MGIKGCYIDFVIDVFQAYFCRMKNAMFLYSSLFCGLQAFSWFRLLVVANCLRTSMKEKSISKIMLQNTGYSETDIIGWHPYTSEMHQVSDLTEEGFDMKYGSGHDKLQENGLV